MNTSDASRQLLPGAPAAIQNPSHDELVTHEEAATGAVAERVDAIVVPTGRRPASLHMAIGVASELDCTLLLLCSRYSDHRAAARLAANAGVDVVAVNATALPPDLMPTLATTELLAGTKFARHTDTSLKRNLGLLLARLAGWERVVFLDDDIEVPDPRDLEVAAGLLARYHGVGLNIGGYPDNSVVCHAYRETGSFQDTFIGGGALAFGSSMFDSFFPNIYNEDWFFLLDEQCLRKSAVAGYAMQQPYDPFASDERARSEELGDCIAEGVFGLLDQHRGIENADERYWRRFLNNRKDLITDTVNKVADLDRDPAEKRRMVAALKAARGRCQIIEPKLCVDYMRAWRSDRGTWRAHLDRWSGGTTEQRGITEAIDMTGLADRTLFGSNAWQPHHQPVRSLAS